MSFSSAENNYKRGNYEQAAREYEIVLNTLQSPPTSRRYLEMRLESLISLIDIYFYRQVNITKACERLQMFMTDMKTIRNQGVLRASTLLDYQRKEHELRASHLPKCESYNGLERDMEQFKRKFEEEFE